MPLKTLGPVGPRAVGERVKVVSISQIMSNEMTDTYRVRVVLTPLFGNEIAFCSNDLL